MGLFGRDTKDTFLSQGPRTLLVSAAEQSLMQFLARAKTRICDRNLFAAARKVDHLLSDVTNTHGVAHIENEDFSSTRECARVYNELGGLGDCHKVSSCFWMSDG